MVEDIKAAVVSTKRHTGMSGGKKRAATEREKKRCHDAGLARGLRGGGEGGPATKARMGKAASVRERERCGTRRTVGTGRKG